jgi:CheY-like chemotaxis protein
VSPDLDNPGESREISVPNRILVVDDDPIVCELIQEVLASAELQSLAVTDSDRATSHLAMEKFGAVFLDVRMPPPDGIELTRRIRASSLNRATPIVIITGEEDNAVLGRAFDARANFFLFKPIDRHRMLRLIRVTERSIQHEGRRFQRVRTACQVSLHCGQEHLTGATVDLSLGGMLVRSTCALPVGSAVRVDLQLQTDKPPLQIIARVVRVSGVDCMGLEIENPESDEESKRLQEFLLPLILAKSD